MKKLIATAVLSACSMAYANTDIPNYSTDSHLYEFTQTYDLVAPKGSQGQANLWVPLPFNGEYQQVKSCLLYTSPSPRDLSTSRMPSSA